MKEFISKTTCRIPDFAIKSEKYLILGVIPGFSEDRGLWCLKYEDRRYETLKYEEVKTQEYQNNWDWGWGNLLGGFGNTKILVWENWEQSWGRE